MVKIAIAGGSGNVGQEVLDGLVAANKHEILLLSRKDVPAEENMAPSVTWVKVNYDDPKQLEGALQGVDTVLSFIMMFSDDDFRAQKALIDAAVQAGVRRYAPSEWATSGLDHLSWYAGKAKIREYLNELNKDRKVLEYSLFQPGLFLNYFTYPYKSAKHLMPLEMVFDFNNRRAIILEGADNSRITLTLVKDFVNVMAKAVEYEGEWPLISGIQGNETTLGELLALGEKIRGPFTIDKLKAEELKAGVVESTWFPKVEHPSLTTDAARQMEKVFLQGISLSFAEEAWNVSNEWNLVLPNYTFIQPEEFLTKFWEGKP